MLVMQHDDDDDDDWIKGIDKEENYIEKVKKCKI